MKHIKQFTLNENNEYKQESFDRFIKELEQLSEIYGFVLKVTGGIIYDPDNSKIINVRYSNDLSSGDIYPEYVKWSNGEILGKE